MIKSAYNIIIIGGGSGGLLAAAGAAGLGARVALVEAHKMGGDCLNYGCVPSKAFIRCAKQAHLTRKGGFGLPPAEPKISWKQVIQHVQHAVDTIAPHDSVERFQSLGVNVFLGQGKLTAPNQVTVTAPDKEPITLKAKSVLISTGSQPAIPDIPGLAGSDFLTNESIFYHPTQPATILVIGGGAIGVELGQSLARLGSQVYLAGSSPRLLSREDPDVSESLQTTLQGEGLNIYTNTTVTSVQKQGQRLSVQLEPHNQQPQSLVVDKILVAAGRKPNTENIGLKELGIKTQQGFITVNQRMQTNLKNIFACGDASGPYLFTHMAGQQARTIIQNALLPVKSKIQYHAVPWCIFTDPEIAHAGLSETQTQQQNLPYRVVKLPLSKIDRAITDGSTNGFLKLIVNTKKNTLLGAYLISPHAGEIISQLTLVIQHQLPLSTISNTIHPYPTLAEICRQAADANRKYSFTPRMARIFKTYLRWTR